MTYTLKELQQHLQMIINGQGEDTPCAAWIYTPWGLCELSNGDDDIEIEAVIKKNYGPL